MTTYDSWIDRIDNLITLIKQLGYDEPITKQLGYDDTITCSFTMNDLLELKLIITTCKLLAEKEGRKYEDFFK